MKFTNGYWLTRDEIEPIYAVEYGYHRVDGDVLQVYAPSMHISRRGDCVNIPMLTITFSSPMEDVIKVSVEHFRGKVRKGPFFEKKESDVNVRIIEDEKCIRYESGRLCAVIGKEESAWKVSFYRDGKFLTESSYRNMARMFNRDTGKSYITEQLLLDVGEQIYGLGERFTPFVKNGQIVDMWNEDGGTASEQTYKNIPFYLSSKGYGVFVDDAGDVSYEIGSEKVERVQFSVEGERLDYYLIGGADLKDSIRLYTDLTGKPALPPAWTFGLWLTTSFSTDYNEEIVTSFLDGMKERDIPLRVFHFDSFWMRAFEWCNFEWDSTVFDHPEEILKRYHERGLKLCVWINPYIAQNSALFDEAAEKGYLIRTADGSIWQTDLWQSGMGEVDFTNPDAAKWYQSKLERLIDSGVDSFKTDFGERIPVKNIVYHDGSDPVKMHNYYSYLYNKTVFELLERKFGKNKAAVFARAATTGGQQFPVHWGGDCSASYPSMAETLRGGLSLGMGGFGFWSHDISGFEQCATPDIYKRWCAFGLLSSHSRLHGGTTYRVPWLFDEESCDVLRFFVKLKCRLMPYLYAQAMEAHTDGTPLLRAMVLEFPEDKNCRSLDLEYMLGESLFVAPIFREDSKVEYYLPHGKWVHLLDGRCVDGGSWRSEEYDYMSLPLFIRENHILLLGNRDDVPDYDYENGFTVCIPEFEDGASAKAVIPSEDGEKAGLATAVRNGNQIMVEISMEKTSGGENTVEWNLKKIGNEAVRIEKDGNKAVIYL
ncbi:alpha-xylosidase [Mediterraneibacter glycyrrhizinilyticus]|uniref:alpha-xylosidase n=1 Tax=Mediterraneibacter glycyrrhizinilyticus TaxID=342942 RepID=UPI00303908D5|nr:alpha-xylosidase [Lachnospiraceae bacterium]